MAAIDPADVPASEGAAALPAQARLTDVVAREEAAEDQDEQTLLRIANLPRGFGWTMISVGVLGVVLPGIPGAPFLAVGIAVLAPGGPRLLTRWARRRPKGLVNTGLKQIGRLLDDLERRYPRPPYTSS
jgi:hypothetical protein